MFELTCRGRVGAPIFGVLGLAFALAKKAYQGRDGSLYGDDIKASAAAQ